MNLGNMTPKFIVYLKNPSKNRQEKNCILEKFSKNREEKKSENVITLRIWGDLACQILTYFNTLVQEETTKYNRIEYPDIGTSIYENLI